MWAWSILRTKTMMSDTIGMNPKGRTSRSDQGLF